MVCRWKILKPERWTDFSLITSSMESGSIILVFLETIIRERLVGKSFSAMSPGGCAQSSVLLHYYVNIFWSFPLPALHKKSMQLPLETRQLEDCKSSSMAFNSQKIAALPRKTNRGVMFLHQTCFVFCCCCCATLDVFVWLGSFNS